MSPVAKPPNTPSVSQVAKFYKNQLMGSDIIEILPNMLCELDYPSFHRVK